MKKRLLALFLAVLFIIPTSIVSFAENPTSLEAPINLNAREDNGSIMVRWTVPKSVKDYAVNSDGEMIYVFDWKKNDGPWHNSGAINESTLEKDTEQIFYGSVGNIPIDENDVQERFFVYFHFGPEEKALDLVNNSYTFRLRFAFDDYNKNGEDYLVSPFSNEATIGKGAMSVAPTSLAAPTNLKVEVKKNTSGTPYFYLNWANPASVSKTNESFPIEFKVDFKVGSGKWFSETHTHDWWGSDDFATHINFDPVEKEMADKIVIEENTYYFRILYAYEPTYGDRVYSPYSNIVSAGVQASEWAKGELQGAFDNDLVPDILKGKDLTKPITREEFAELAVLLYEKASGKTAVPVSPNPLNDTNNPQILKAYALGITKGTKTGTSNIPFEPNTLISREQVAAMLFRTIKLIDPDGDYSIASVKDFPDQKNISSYALEACKYMSKMGIVKGDAQGYFWPRALTTVDQAKGFGMATREAAIIMSNRTYNVTK